MKTSSISSILSLAAMAAAPALTSCSSSALPSAISEGFYNSTTSGLHIKLAGRYDAGSLGLSASVMEIVAYNAANGYAYAVNGLTGKLSILHVSAMTGAVISASEIDVKAAVKGRDAGFNYKDMTSVAVAPDGKSLAIALQGKRHTDTGRAAIFSCAADGSLSLLDVITIGVQPDMICYADSNTILSANEGEARKGYEGEIDPKGGVSIINIKERSCVNIGFDAFDSPAMRQKLLSRGVLLKKGALPSLDLEPEYITVVGNKAYISLQEANAIAVLNISQKRMENVYGLGFADYGRVKVDLGAKDKTYAPRNFPGVYGVRMPDAIASYQVGGSTYIVTANEGDGREWGDYENEVKVNLKDKESSPAGHIQPSQFTGKRGKVTLLNTESMDGLDEKKDYLFGTRSFSIFRVTGSGLQLVFDSGSQFEEVVANTLAHAIPLSGDKLGLDDRSGKKGPEPESVTLGKIANKTYAFIALERAGGIMVYDITRPQEARFVNYFNSRDFKNISMMNDEDGDPIAITGGDISPEGLSFISAAESKTGKPMLLVANELSGTVIALELTSL